MTQRQESAFWIYQSCPTCGHLATTVYTPDLLRGPVESECKSKYNPCARPCSNPGWGYAVERNSEAERSIRRHIRIAERMDRLFDEAYRIKKELRA